MTWRWVSALAGLTVLASGSERLAAQQGVEAGVHTLATVADFTFLGGGTHLSLRPGGRTRFALSLSSGTLDGEFALRGESTAQFLLNPASLRHGFYAGGGLAFVAGGIDEAYFLLVIGVESRPGGRSGWVVESGIGGGVRVMIGYRWRKLQR